MCGICGIVGEKDNALVKKMTNYLSHRGPDGHGFYDDKNISLGHRRLAIIDLDSGNQPMCNEEGTIWIVYNGEIYNHKQLRTILEEKGHEFKTNCDTESIIHAYEQFGENLTSALHGMYAFAIWDSVEKKLLLARDSVGIKPLYYSHIGKSLIFSSEYKSILLHDSIKSEVNPRSIRFFLNYGFVGGRETLIQGIQKLPPGHMLTWKNGKSKLKRFWEPKMVPLHGQSESFYSSRIRKHLVNSVKMRLMSDVPVGTTLSGGTDSSAIAAILSKLDVNLKAFTVGFDEPDSEIEIAESISNNLGIEHHTRVIDTDEIVETIPKIIWHMEDVSNIGNEIPTYYFTELASKSVKVLLIGEGSDELFGGYKLYLPFTTRKNFPSLRESLNELKRIGNSRGVGTPNGVVWKFFPAVSGIIPKSFRMNQYFSNLESSNIAEPEFGRLVRDVASQKSVLDVHRSKFLSYMDVPQNQLLNRCMLFYQKESIPNFHLNRIDKIGMSHSIECRVPFLDTDLINFANSIPDEFKIRNYSEKYIYKKAVNTLLPKKIFRKKKVGLDTPFHTFFRTNTKFLCDNYISKSTVNKRGFFRYEEIEKLHKKITNTNVREGRRHSKKSSWGVMC